GKIHGTGRGAGGTSVQSQRADRSDVQVRPAKEAGRRYREPVGWVLAKLVRVEPDGDRAVIDQRDVHMGSELAGGHIQAELAELLGQIVDQGTGNLRRGGSDEAGASALAGVGVQGELRDNQ